MYVALAIHRHLKPGSERDFLAAQEALSQTMKGHRGFRERHVFRDEAQGIFVSLGIWESREDHEAATPELRKHFAEQYRAGKGVSNFEEEPEELHFLTPVQSVRS